MMAICVIITKALISYAAVAVLVVLFWIVFGIIGMNIFGEVFFAVDLPHLGCSPLGYSGVDLAISPPMF